MTQWVTIRGRAPSHSRWGCLLGRCWYKGGNCYLKPKLPARLALPSRAVDGSCQQENETTLPRGDRIKGTGRTLLGRVAVRGGGIGRGGPQPPALEEMYSLT